MTTQHVLSFSGGKDSTAMYLRALELGIEFTPVFADTGNEHPITLEYVRTIHKKTGGPEVRTVQADFSEQIARKRRYIETKWAAKGVALKTIERALEVLVPTGIPFLDLCLWKGRFSSTKARFCSIELKRNPIIEQTHFPLVDEGNLVVSWQGVRADESKERASPPRLDRNGLRQWNYRPILYWKVEDVFAIHQRHKVEPNPLYLQGMVRVGCMPCIHSRKSELNEISKRFPEEFDRVERWERLVSNASKRGVSTFFAANTNPGHEETRSRIREVEKWAKTTRGGRQYNMVDLLEEQPTCSSLYGLCE